MLKLKLKNLWCSKCCCPQLPSSLAIKCADWSWNPALGSHAPTLLLLHIGRKTSAEFTFRFKESSCIWPLGLRFPTPAREPCCCADHVTLVIVGRKRWTYGGRRPHQSILPNSTPKPGTSAEPCGFTITMHE